MKKINIIQLLQKIQSGTQPKTIKVFGSYYDWSGDDYFNNNRNEYIYDRFDVFSLKDFVNEYCIEIPEQVSLTKAEKKWLESIIELCGFSRDVIIRKEEDSTTKYLGMLYTSVPIILKDTKNIYKSMFDKSYFKDMESNHDYTPDDLGLFNEEDE